MFSAQSESANIFTLSLDIQCADQDRFFFFSSRRRHTRFDCDWSSDVCSSDLNAHRLAEVLGELDLLEDDTTPAIRTWIDRCTGELPAGFAGPVGPGCWSCSRGERESVV